MNISRRKYLLFALIALLVLSACAPESAETPTSDILQRPSNPEYSQKIWDCNTGQIIGGENASGDLIEPNDGCDSWQINRYERPFNAETQDQYFSDLDIISAELGQSGDWFFFRMTLFEDNKDSDLLEATYALELDLDLDGRGDVLVLARAPGGDALNDWVRTGVQFWGDQDNGVGDDIALLPDPPNQSNGFDTLVFDQGEGDEPDLAWVRMKSGRPATIEIAFKSKLILFDEIFKWWAWTDQGVDNPAFADLHDTFDYSQAGDPYQGQANFPSKQIFALDNTCAVIWGAIQDSGIDLCVNDPNVVPPEVGPSNTPTSQTTPGENITPTPSPTRPTATSTEPITSLTPCIDPAGSSVTCTPTATLTPTRITSTPCIPPGNTNNIAGNAAALTCTPTPTPTRRITTTPCFPANNTTGAAVVTCTPTPTRVTLTPSPTICYNVDQSPNIAGPQIRDCTPTPTMTLTPTDCFIPYAFALIDCTRTPTSTPTATATRCVTPDASGQMLRCTPTPTPTASATVCVHYGLTALLICSPTPTQTQCVSSTAAAVVPCTPTPTPTPCIATDDAGNVTTCTPTPVALEAMAYPDEDTNCREAPNGRIIDTLFEGQGYLLRGRDASNTWIFLRGPNGRLCWAFAALMTFTHEAHEAELSEIPSDWLSIILTPSSTPTATIASAPSIPTNTSAPASVPQCSDGIDNDGDQLTDYVAPSAAGGTTGDPQCSSANDNDESR